MAFVTLRMTFQHFITLPAYEQEIIMWYRGQAVAERIDKLNRYLLYQVDAFYIEVGYALNFNIIRFFKPFNTTELLDPYLEDVYIDPL